MQLNKENFFTAYRQQFSSLVYVLPSGAVLDMPNSSPRDTVIFCYQTMVSIIVQNLSCLLLCYLDVGSLFAMSVSISTKHMRIAYV